MSVAPGLLVVGRREYVEFPEWGLPRMRVKIDTGAYSSALDVAEYDLRDDPEGGLLARLRFEYRTPRVIHAPVLRLVWVKSSSGCRQERPLIEAEIGLGPVR